VRYSKAVAIAFLVLQIFFCGGVYAEPQEVIQARQLVENGKLEDAVSLLKSSSERMRGESLLQLRYELGLTDTDPVNAVSELKSVAALSPKMRAAALLAAGELMLIADQPQSALEFFAESAGMKESSISEHASYLHAVALYRSGKYEESRQKWADHLITYLEGKYQPASRLGIAAANIKLGRFREAIEIYKAVLAQHPGIEEEAWLLQNLSELLKENLSEARKYSERLQKDYSDADIAFVQAPSGAVQSSERLKPQTRIPPASPRPAPQPAAASASSSKYTIQVGAFGVRENAVNLAERLKREGYIANIQARNNLTVVTVGAYSDIASAERDISKIEKLIGERPRIVNKSR